MASLFRVFKPAESTLCAAAFALATLLSAPLASPAAAQGLGWFGNLFGGGLPRQTQSAPTYPGYNNGSGYAPRTHAESYYNRPRHRLPRRKPVEQVQREAPKERPPTPPKNASIFVYVFGDSLGQMLADGLDDSFVDRQDVAVVHKARGSTGLVTAEYYDWPKSIAELLAGHDIADAKGEKPAADKAKGDVTEAKGDAGAGKDAKAVAKADAKPARVKIDVAVMMIGSNDRQPLQVDGKTVQPGTPSWTAAYSKRVMAIDEAFRAKNVPLVWVGVPITKDDGYADAMAALNDIYREAAGKTGAIYVDTWEAFSDDNGNFSSYGPDVNGQTVRLRAADGIQFTKAGARKLAHFVETHVRRALDGKTPAPELPTAELPNDPAQDGSAKDGSATDGRPKDEKAKPVVAARPDVGPIRNLNEPPTATSGTLATLDAKTSARETYSAILHATGPAPAGRADDSRWPGDTRANP